MSRFVKLATLDGLPPGSALEIEHEGRIVALFNLDGQVHAIDGVCPHQGGPLASGVVQGKVVTCPWHGWQLNVDTGAVLHTGRVRQPVYEVRIDGQDILVALDT